MQRETILSKLHEQKTRLGEAYGVTRIGIFGSVARNEADADSDVDIIVDMPPDLFQMVHMKEELEELLAVPVDLIRYHPYLNDYLKNRIDNEAIFI